MIKNQAVFALSLTVLVFLNIPLSFAGLIADNGKMPELLSGVILTGAGISNLAEQKPKEHINISLATVISKEIPAIRFLMDQHDSVLYENSLNNLPIADTSLGYSIEKLNYNERFHRGSPQVLIYHTHTTESFQIEAGPGSWRSKNKDISVVATGNIIAKTLYNDFGIEVLHITEIFDSPVYNGSYERSLAMLEKAIEQYPSIQYVFDVHRDGVDETPANKQSFTTVVDGQKAAKVSIVLGVKSKFTPENKKFAKAIESSMNKLYPGLFKRHIEKDYYYNQFVVPNSILFEMGCNISTPEEARYSAVLVGRSVGTVIMGKEQQQ
ncbi:MAG: stage II sporulation protein P [Eubacteriaceae bacterium]|nr:stage II sporulation protein P [Eubacteriaceae bacterium]